jgi:hypothetical protein
MSFEIRYFFDPGSGACLWSKNAAARERFGIPIDHRNLEMSEHAKRWLDHLIAWFDTSLNWEAPPEMRWSDEEWKRFREAASAGLQMLRAELPPPEWEFVDEVRS